MANVKLNPEFTGGPKQDPALGDKTPAYVAWLKKNHPKAYAAKFTNWNNK